MIPTLSSLISPVTPANALASILQIAQGLGLSTTSWGPFGMVISILETMAEVVAEGSEDVAYTAQGGYASTAAAMVDSDGNAVTTWMDLVASEVYGAQRLPAVQAAGLVAFANTSSARGPFAVGALHLKHPVTGATYSNTVAGEQIYGTGAPGIPYYSTMHFAADAGYPGKSGNAVGGTVLQMVTPFPGVSVCALGAEGSSDDLVGTDAEKNFALLDRCKQKIEAIAPNGADGAMMYVATTPRIVALFGTVSAPINRARRFLDSASGVCSLYLANADGPATLSDAAIVQEAEQALVVRTGDNLQCLPAVDESIVVTAIIYVTAPVSGLDALAANAVAAYFASLPIGGTSMAIDGVVPVSGIMAAIQSVVTPAVTGVNLLAPLVNVVMSGPSAVPTLDPSSVFVVVTAAP
jgi:hypothetical protein